MLKRYRMRLGKWLSYLQGGSYQHLPQKIGQRFSPYRLEGYFNDLTHKASWQGAYSQAGVPVVKTDTQDSFEFPIVIFQWSLGHWDEWLISNKSKPEHIDAVRRAADWAVANQTGGGGWLCWTGLERPVSSPYSAMAQGQGISLLLRAYSAFGRQQYLEASERATKLMLEPSYQLVMTDRDGARILEEYPGGHLHAVLNGWIFALVGLKEIQLQNKNDETADFSLSLCEDLVRRLPQYDTGYWSTYDLSGNLASPFYHDLHIHQLVAMSALFPEFRQPFLATAERFSSYKRSRLNTARAVSVKVWQKLLQTSTGEMA